MKLQLHRHSIYLLFLIIIPLISCHSQESRKDQSAAAVKDIRILTKDDVRVGAERMDAYLPMLANKKVGLFINQTSMVGETHLLDTLLSLGIRVKTIFGAEHGFRGRKSDGAIIEDGIDSKTGIPILSIYGKNKRVPDTLLHGIDIVIFDFQDVGVRFFTFGTSMYYMMNACSKRDIPFLLLDRPNPNGFYVDGPILLKDHSSFIGLHPVPLVHGLTLGEYAQMMVGEGWMSSSGKLDLIVVKCKGYDHNSTYDLPIKPSPNLPNLRAVLLYPSLGLLEGTIMSVGRGTDMQFQIVGHPDVKNGSFHFTPVSMPGAKYPKHENQKCYGTDLGSIPISYLLDARRMNLHWLIEYHQQFPGRYFREDGYFDKLAGSDALRLQLEGGMTEDEIRQSWQQDITQFKEIRLKYLLYPDFE